VQLANTRRNGAKHETHFWLVAMMTLPSADPPGQQDELVRRKVEQANPRAIVARLIRQVEELEKQRLRV